MKLQSDIITDPFQIFIVIQGKVNRKQAIELGVPLFNHYMVFLFEEIRYEICGKEIVRIRKVGMTLTLKTILLLREKEKTA